VQGFDVEEGAQVWEKTLSSKSAVQIGMYANQQHLITCSDNGTFEIFPMSSEEVIPPFF
jgi:hypothetical protein